MFEDYMLEISNILILEREARSNKRVLNYGLFVDFNAARLESVFKFVLQWILQSWSTINVSAQFKTCRTSLKAPVVLPRGE